MTKLTPDFIGRMRKLRREGKSTVYIAKIFGVKDTTVCYWVNDKYRAEVKRKQRIYDQKRCKEGKTWRQRNPKKYKKYIREYMRNRYRNDEEFRKNFIAQVVRNKKKRDMKCT